MCALLVASSKVCSCGIFKVQKGARKRALMRAKAWGAGPTPRIGHMRSERRGARLGEAPFLFFAIRRADSDLKRARRRAKAREGAARIEEKQRHGRQERGNTPKLDIPC